MGVEVDIHRAHVTVTGRIACKDAELIDVPGLVRDVYRTAGYGDAYGPRVPIGGGAWSGKDFFKADRAGGIHARRLAALAVMTGLCEEALVRLLWFPGDRTPRELPIEAGNGRTIGTTGLGCHQKLSNRFEVNGFTLQNSFNPSTQKLLARATGTVPVTPSAPQYPAIYLDIDGVFLRRTRNLGLGGSSHFELAAGASRFLA